MSIELEWIWLLVSFWWWIISRTCQGEIPSSTYFPNHITDPDLSAGSSHPGHSWLPYRSSCRPQTAALLMSSPVLCHWCNTGRGRGQVPTLVALLMWRPTPLMMLPRHKVHSLLATRQEALYPSIGSTVDAVPNHRVLSCEWTGFVKQVRLRLEWKTEGAGSGRWECDKCVKWDESGKDWLGWEWRCDIDKRMCVICND